METRIGTLKTLFDRLHGLGSRLLPVVMLALLPVMARADEAVVTDVREAEHRATITTTVRGDAVDTARESSRTETRTRTQAPTLDGNTYSGSGQFATESQGHASREVSSGETGSTTLKNAQTVWDKQVGVSGGNTIQGEHGSVSSSYGAGASATARKGDNGGELALQVGAYAELAASLKEAWGDENFGASAEFKAKVEAVAGAKAKVGLYVDDNGITFGASVSAGAFVSAKAELSFETHVFGVSATVTAWGEAHFGFMAKAEAAVTIGFNGKLSFRLSGGVSVGLGFSGGVCFEVDAMELMKSLNLPDIETLLEWIEGFCKKPKKQTHRLLKMAARKISGIPSGNKTKTDPPAVPPDSPTVRPPPNTTIPDTGNDNPWDKPDEEDPLLPDPHPVPPDPPPDDPGQAEPGVGYNRNEKVNPYGAQSPK